MKVGKQILALLLSLFLYSIKIPLSVIKKERFKGILFIACGDVCRKDLKPFTADYELHSNLAVEKNIAECKVQQNII